MECDWVVGDKIICVNDIFTNENIGHPQDKRPTAGNKYTIRSIRFNEELNSVQVRLVEIVNPVRRYGYKSGVKQEEGAFNISRFRKLQTKKTSIEIFKAMLNKSPEQNKREHNESKVRDALQEFAH